MVVLSPKAIALLAERSYNIEFQGYLSNHVKHAIIALDRLEAPASRVQEYWNEYTTMTPYNIPLDNVDQSDWNAVKPATQEQWKEWRGKKVHWQEQVALMNEQLQDKEDNFHGNTDKLVQTYAPDLLSGLAGALTHGIIHLGWAIDADSPWMIVEGLAYLNFCHLGVDETKFKADEHQESCPMESLIRVANTWEAEHLKEEWVGKAKAAYDGSFHPELVVAGFQWELSKVLKDAHPCATNLPTWLSEMSADKLWESLYRATAWLYLATRDEQGNGNFVVLHLMTSLYGLEHVCRVIDNGPTMIKVTRNALSQFYASLICLLAAAKSGLPSASALENIQTEFALLKTDADDFDWTPIVERAIAETEEHNIKLVYVMKELWNRYERWSGFSEAAKSFTLTPNIRPEKSEFTT